MVASDFDQVVEAYHRALAEFPKGNPEPLKEAYSHREDVTVANPFGPPARGWSEVASTMERAASYYRDGEVAGFETIANYVTPELAYILEIERYRARIGGAADLSAIVLRVTSVFRREDDSWKIIHRHADPIATARPAESVVQK